MLALVAQGAGAAEPAPAAGQNIGRVTVATVRAKEACVKVDARVTGFAIAREETGVTAPPGYRITEILAGEGDRVAAGQELLRGLREAESAAPPAAPPTRGAGGAAAGAAAAAGSLGSTIARAPIAGVVVRVNIRVGDVSGAPQAAATAMAAQGAPPDPPFVISAGSNVDLVVDIPSLYVGQIRKGAVAKVTSDEGVAAKGVVQSPASEVDPATQLGRARLSIEPASAIRPGQFASAVVETARDCGVVVPTSAVSYRNGEATVQMVSGAAVQIRPVRVGLSDSGKIRIRDGLGVGEEIVAHTGAALHAGDRVNAVLIEGAAGAGQ
ncbi:efflux RND transporter periplasmic adaptor subunit [Methylosinus sp. Sm6]|uniref:efflux RND transporter periplasmic adaptor subunit n=1 Tax=Methylosinus sp. Sm6 TaxID=2866948 RepID=UPI001C9A2704|nr:secretion protein HylD [Methylosinus sp. Sm6]MBY6241550.1 secretion protein HylD [Methylosinus sp. Sm6]